MPDLYFHEESDYSEENTCENSFAPPFFYSFSWTLDRKEREVKRAMRKKLNKSTLQLPIYYILE